MAYQSKTRAVQQSNPKTQVFPVVAGLVAGAVLVPPLLWAAWNYWTDIACEHWPQMQICAMTTDGRIKQLERTDRR